jgi:hypothetical protein
MPIAPLNTAPLAAAMVPAQASRRPSLRAALHLAALAAPMRSTATSRLRHLLTAVNFALRSAPVSSAQIPGACDHEAACHAAPPGLLRLAPVRVAQPPPLRRLITASHGASFAPVSVAVPALAGGLVTTFRFAADASSVALAEAPGLDLIDAAFVSALRPLVRLLGWTFGSGGACTSATQRTSGSDRQ